MIITGRFGQHLYIDKAVIMGLLPDAFCRESMGICNTMNYLDFSSRTKFMDEFIRAQFLSHTEGRLFPSVLTRKIHKGNAV